MNIELLQELISENYINVQKHPSADLYIYNYSPKAQYDRVWNEWTLTCRGLILDENYQFVARPFKKFFNLEEHIPEEIPNENFEVYEKMDGSLGILYWLNGQPFIATRGSFTSEQSKMATQILHSKYAHIFETLQKNKTYLFEIIYPQNRIVIDYGEMEDLTLLAIIDTIAGKDEPLENIGFQVVKRYDGISDLKTLKSLQEENREGFVIKYKSGFRVKVKFEEYVRLHRILTRVSTTNIWEYLSTNQSFDEILDKVPDEFYDWVKKVVSDLKNSFIEIENDCKTVFKDFGNRKETALYFQTQKYTSVLFNMLDGKTYDYIIWKMLKPKYEKPFKIDTEG